MDVRDKIKQQATGKLRVTVNAKALRDIIERAERVELVAWQMSNCIYNAKQISSWESVLGKLVDLQTQFDAIRALAPATMKLVDTMRHKDGSHCADKGQCRRAHLYAPDATTEEPK